MGRFWPILSGRKSSNPMMWSAWPCVSKTASRRSIPARSACERKSGVVSIRTCWPLRERSTEVRRRLSRGSVEVHTAQRQPMVGTPMDVPEPRIVRRRGVADISKIATRTGRYSAPALAGFGLAGLRGRLRRESLIDLEIGQLQLSVQVEQQTFFFRRKIAFGLFVQGVEHVDQFTRRVGIDHRLAGPRVGVAAQHHGRVTAQHADQVFKRGRTLGGVGCRRSLAVGIRGRCRWWCRRGFLFGFLARFAFLFFDDFLPQFALRGKGPAVYDAERLFWFLLGHGQPQLESFTSLARAGTAMLDSCQARPP